MWVLTNISSGESFRLFGENAKYAIGRLGADLVLRNDKSISRNHAFLHLETNDTVMLEDGGSKYGTFFKDGIASNKGLKKGESVLLRNGDRIRFGLFQNLWNISHMPLAVLTSALPAGQVEQLQKYLTILGGRLLQNLDAKCTYLTMGEFSITMKVLHALLDEIPIVTCDYWRDLIKAIRSKQQVLPVPELYAPKRCESLIQKHDFDLGRRPQRKQLFVGMTFIFMNRRQIEMYAPIVRKAGGDCKDLNKPFQKDFLVKSNVVVVQYVPATESQSFQTINSIQEHLELHSRRTIPEYEIGLAILHCSITKYCNPSYKVLIDLIPSTLATTESNSPETVFVENTNFPSCKLGSDSSEVLVPETEETNTIQSKVLQQSVEPSAETVSSAILRLAEPHHQIDVDEDFMPTIRVTESVAECSQKRKCGTTEGSQKRKCGSTEGSQKRKCSAEHSERADDRSEDELFSFTKIPHIDSLPKKLTMEEDLTKTQKIGNVEKITEVRTALKTASMFSKTTSKSRMKPLNITVTKKADKTTTRVSGFLEKSQATTKINTTSTEQKEIRKRSRIAVISDDDDTDLFAFNDASTTATRGAKKARVKYGNDNSDDELFNFTTTSNDCVDNIANSDNENDLVPTQQFMPAAKARTGLMPLVTPKPLPQKVNIAGWLSKSLNNIKIQDEESEVDFSKVKNEMASEEYKKWIDTLKGCFVVRTYDLNVSSRPKDMSQSQFGGSTTNSQSILNNTSKNFKAFVKKRNLHPQQRVIPTVKILVSRFANDELKKI